MTEITPFGDRALRFPLPVSSSTDRRALLAALRAVAGVVDVVLTETVGAAILASSTSFETVRAALAAALALGGGAEPAPAPVRHTIRVFYDGADLASVATLVGLTPEEVIGLHTATDYEVAMLGFMPGFAYLRGLDPRLVLPRRAEPRTRVPAGSVAIAAEYTGIYPFASPGGWNLLGEALDPRLLDDAGARFAVGDRVRFEAVERPAYVLSQTNTKRGAPIAPPGAHLDVRKALGLAIVIDGGRVGHMHEAVPHGGALVPEALARANAAAGNEPGAAAIEVYGTVSVAARGRAIAVADDVRGAVVLEDGQSLVVSTDGLARVRYLAVRGGLDVRTVLGGRGTMLGARLGGLDGRALSRGDLLSIARTKARESVAPVFAVPGTPSGDGAASALEIEIVLGPDLDERVSDAMLAGTFTIGADSDRVGTRLHGPPLPAHSMHAAHDRKSMPMVSGAIQVTPTGLVVLGPDHPTTGGYPVIAVVTSAALGTFFARPLGARIKLTKTS